MFERIPKSPPVVNRVPESEQRPRWSVMIPAYNCSSYLRHTIQSVLQQDPGSGVMQIEVVDDASTDEDVEKLVRDIGQGRVQYYRQPFNVGNLRNFETCLNRAKGVYVHLLHGDDSIENGYYQKMEFLFQTYPEAGAAFCRSTYMNEEGRKGSLDELLLPQDGILPNWLYTIAEYQRLQYAAISVKRSVYEHLGSFYACSCGEDWEMWARIAKHYPVAYTPELLSNYRLHFESISGYAFKDGRNLRELGQIIRLINQHIDEPNRKRMYKAARKRLAYNSLAHNEYIWIKTKRPRTVFWQIYEILKLHIDFYTVRRGSQFLWRSVAHKIGLSRQ